MTPSKLSLQLTNLRLQPSGFLHLLLCLPFGEFEAGLSRRSAIWIAPARNICRPSSSLLCFTLRLIRFVNSFTRCLLCSFLPSLANSMAEFIGVKPAFKRPTRLAIASGVTKRL